jgi:Ca2+/Na+ antiporter
VSIGRKVGLAVIALLLTLSLTGSAVLFTGNQTVLSGEFVKESANESELYDGVRETLVDRAGDELENASISDGPIALEVDAAAVANESITDEFVRTQAESNIDRLYAFLNGERETLNLSVDTTTVQDNLAEALGEEAGDIDIPAAIDEATGGVDTEVGDTGVTFPLNGTTFERMESGEDAYNEQRRQFQNRVEAALLDRAYQQRSPAELLVLIGEDPRQYTEAERQQIVENREEEIKTAIAETDQFQQAFDTALEEGRDVVVNRIDAQIGEQLSDRGTAVRDPVRELAVAMVDGLFTDQSHDTFTDRTDQARTDLADAVEQLARDRIQENFPAEIALTEDIDEEQQETLDEIAGYVQLTGPFVLGLFLFALLLVGGGYALSRSAATTLLTAGSSAAISGVTLLLVATVGGDLVLDEVAAIEVEEEVAPAVDFAVTLLGQTFDLLTTVSAALLVAGLVAGVAGVYLRRSDTESGADAGTDDRTDAGADPETEGETDAEAGSEVDDTGAGPDAEADADAETAPEAEAETDADTEADLDTEAETDADTDTDTGTDTDTETRDEN